MPEPDHCGGQAASGGAPAKNVLQRTGSCPAQGGASVLNRPTPPHACSQSPASLVLLLHFPSQAAVSLHGCLQEIEIFDIAYNNLTGSIPTYYQDPIGDYRVDYKLPSSLKWMALQGNSLNGARLDIPAVAILSFTRYSCSSHTAYSHSRKASFGAIGSQLKLIACVKVPPGCEFTRVQGGAGQLAFTPGRTRPHLTSS